LKSIASSSGSRAKLRLAAFAARQYYRCSRRCPSCPEAAKSAFRIFFGEFVAARLSLSSVTIGSGSPAHLAAGNVLRLGTLAMGRENGGKGAIATTRDSTGRHYNPRLDA
jgi:hypothetical protein